MCGRFTRKEGFQQLAKMLELQVWPHLDARYNIAPSQFVACVRTNPDSMERECVEMKWGLIPSWAKEPRIGHQLINARAETVADKPAFRKAFRNRRCLILADGFYEWRREKKTKQPYFVRFVDNRPFAFAGVWERWERMEGNPLDSCALITTAPNAVMKPIHYRMPVILHPTAYALWLDDSMHHPQGLMGLLQPYPHEEMEAFPVSPLVNNPLNDSPECLQP